MGWSLAVVGDLEIGCCGICCSLCPCRRSGDCPGCAELPGCQIRRCAADRGLALCFDCPEFPCRLYDEGFEWDLEQFPPLAVFHPGVVRWRPFSPEYVQMFRWLQQYHRQRTGPGCELVGPSEAAEQGEKEVGEQPQPLDSDDTPPPR